MTKAKAAKPSPASLGLSGRATVTTTAEDVLIIPAAAQAETKAAGWDIFVQNADATDAVVVTVLRGRWPTPIASWTVGAGDSGHAVVPAYDGSGDMIVRCAAAAGTVTVTSTAYPVRRGV